MELTKFLDVWFLRRLLDYMLVFVTTLVVLDIELDATKLDNVTSIELVVEVVLSRLGVSDNDKHFVVYVLVWYRVAFFIARCLGNNCVILDLEATILLLHNDHRLGIFIDLFRLCPDGDKLNIIVDPENLTTSLGLNILLGNVL